MSLFGYLGKTQQPDFDALKSGVAARLGALTLYLRGSPRQSAEGILAAYQRSGSATLANLTGSFAVAIVDAERNSVLLAVDRMGIEQLAYSCNSQRATFGSSPLQVARAPGASVRIRPQGLYEYLFHHMVPAPGTIFENVFKLRAGNCAQIEQGKCTVRRYWQPSFAAASGAARRELPNRLRQVLGDAVSRCAGLAAPAGAFLSGGLDSSTVAGYLARVGPQPAHTFSIGFGYADYDELSYARIANQRFGCIGHEHTIQGGDILQAFPLLARAFPEPFGNSSALPAYFCALLARQQGFAHLLAGDGGDELFAGNSRYADQRVFERYFSLPRALRRRVLEPLVQRLPTATLPVLLRKARGYIAAANCPLPERLELWNLLQRLGSAEVLHADLLQAVDLQGPHSKLREFWLSTPSDEYLHRMLYLDWQYTLADNDLRKVQLTSQLAGVRVSYPMLEADVVDMSTTVPAKLMMPGRKLRDFYKRTMRGFLPDEIIHKKKHGFGLPFGLWLQDSPALRDLILGNISDLGKRRLINQQFIDKLLHLHNAEDARYYGVFVWVLAMLEQWLKENQLSI